MWSGSEIRLVPTRPTTPRDMSDPRCGVARKTTRLTNGSGLKKRYLLQLLEHLARAEDGVERPVRVEPPELVAARDRHHVAEQAAHAVAQQDHPVEGGSRPSGSYICLAWISESRRLAAAIGIGTPVGYM